MILLHKKIIALITLAAFVIGCLPAYVYADQTIAPNLMVIFGNSYSMNRELDDKTLPPVTTPLHFNDTSGASLPDGAGTVYPQPLYGDQPTSKLFIAKQALTDVLNNPASDNINIGFATFRQTFGMEVAATEHNTRATRPVLEALDANLLTSGTTQAKQTYGNVATNFKATEWNRIQIGGAPKRSAKFGRGLYDAGQNVIDDSLSTYITAATGGLPKNIIYRDGTTDACGTVSAINPLKDCATLTKIHDQSYTDSNYGAKESASAVFNASGATGNRNPASATNPLVNWQLCNTYYNSQNNTFNAYYLADKDVIDSYATQDSYHSISYVGWDVAKFDATTGISKSPLTSVACTGDGSTNGSFTGQYQESSKRITNQSNTTGNPRIYFSGIAHYYSGTTGVGSELSLQNGVLSGWSGESDYKETDPLTKTGNTVASFPAHVADPNKSGRELIKRGWQQTNAQHMGVFLDLPLPEYPYLDQRAIVKGFMGLQQMDPSGLDYDPVANTIANGKGIAASTFDTAYYPHQSPVYDALRDALAYYTVYNQVDSYKNCRSNNILLFYDGKEDAHWTDADASQYLKPADMAAQLLKDLGVKTYVVILSNNKGDIDSADEIAAAGGTNTAYKATDAASLFTSFSAVFAGLSGPEKATAAPLVPANISDNSKLYQVSYSLNPIAGHLRAYTLTTTGFVDNTPLWDAADSSDPAIPASGRMNAVRRTTDLWSNYAVDSNGGTLVALHGLDVDAFAVSNPPPTVGDIINYTIDPSYNGGIYLAGRATGSFMGAFSDSSMAPLLLTQPFNAVLDKTDANFKTYENNQKNRNTSVLVQNDDGFLYSFNGDTGAFLWGWMPRELVAGLKSYATFWSSGNMRGGSVIADAPTANNGYATFVLGTAQSGALHYALKLKNDIDSPPNAIPDVVAWSHAIPNATSPLAQAPVITHPSVVDKIYDGYANYMTTVGTESQLHVHKIAVGEQPSSVVLPFTASSELVEDNGYFYVGDTNGMIWKMPVASDAVKVLDEIDVVNKTCKTGKTCTVGTTYNNDPAKFIGLHQYRKEDYLWASSTTQLTVFVKKTGTTESWQKVWEVHLGGAGSWDLATGLIYTADVDSVTTPTAGKIQILPINATLPSRPVVVKGAILLPVLVPDPNEPCAAGKGYYYLYALDKGDKPKALFRAISSGGAKSKIDGNIFIGLGTPMTAAITRSASGVVVRAIANQPAKNVGSDPNSSEQGKGIEVSAEGGLISWREIIN